MKKEKGFTLIELVIVIVILGILAATGLSKFMDVTEEAKNASVEGTASGFAAGVMMVRGQWEAKGRPQTYSVNTTFYDGTWLQLTTPTRDQRENKGLMPGYPMEAGKPTQKSGSTSVTLQVLRSLPGEHRQQRHRLEQQQPRAEHPNRLPAALRLLHALEPQPE